jgi:hypothetical protein
MMMDDGRRCGYRHPAARTFDSEPRGGSGERAILRTAQRGPGDSG